MPVQCRIEMLGRFAVFVGAHKVSPDAWRGRRSADLVKLLALSPGRAKHREEVMDALWPDLDPTASAANLRKAIHYARRALGHNDAITSEGAMLALWPDAEVSVDVQEFEELSATDPAAAVEAYAGDLLPADLYEPWAEEPRRRLRDRYISSLKAVAAWERVIELDPTDEQAYRELMRGAFEAGDRREAIRYFERLRDALRDHIGVGPDRATVELYERVLAMEGHEPPSPAEQAAALVANGLLAWNRKAIEEAERLALEARALAVVAGAGHELGEAATLLALVAYARDSWHDLFLQHFGESVEQSTELALALYDAHLCFSELYLYGPEWHRGTPTFARKLLSMATTSGSVAGEAMARLLLGEYHLLSGDPESALEELQQAFDLSSEAGAESAMAISLERLAEAEVALGRRARARPILERAHRLAESSTIPSHCVVRVFGVELQAAESTTAAIQVVRRAERRLADAPRVCEPCSMNYLVGASIASARVGDLSRARHFVEEAERITNLWRGGPWLAAVAEARAHLLLAEGDRDEAVRILSDAARRFAEQGRPQEAARCEVAAQELAGATGATG